MNVTLYGIPNCDQVKKARTHLEAAGIDYHFHDFKKAGLSADTVRNWLKQVDLDTLINRKGTTWRALSDEQKASAATADKAIALMQQYPSIIKRPVLALDQRLSVGYSDAAYQQLLNK